MIAIVKQLETINNFSLKLDVDRENSIKQAREYITASSKSDATQVIALFFETA